MKVLFFGTPKFAVPVLEAIYNNSFQIVAVVTSPDKEAGRGLQIRSSDIKKTALNLNLKVLQPNDLSDPNFINEISDLKPDIAVVVAFKKLPFELLTIPKLGTFNIHASLLPQYRGAAPINHVIINGETKTGITSFFINENIDTGNIILQKEINIDETDNYEKLYEKLSLLGAEVAIDTLKILKLGSCRTFKQDDIIKQESISELKKAPKIFKNHCLIDWNLDAIQIINRIRGLSPVPGAYSVITNNINKTFSIKILSAIIARLNIKIGTCVFSDNKMYVGCGNNSAIEILELQPESRKKMTSHEFVRGIIDKENWEFINKY